MTAHAGVVPVIQNGEAAYRRSKPILNVQCKKGYRNDQPVKRHYLTVPKAIS